LRGLFAEAAALPKRSRPQSTAIDPRRPRDLAREIAKTHEYRISRCQRKKVEMLFAHLKRILKLDRLRLRGPRAARNLAHLARTSFFKPVHVKSLPAHAVRSLIIARKKLVGQRVTLENQIRGLAVVFGVRLPRALTAAFIRQALKASEGITGLSAAMRGLVAARTAVFAAVVAIDADIRQLVRSPAACRRLMTIAGVGQLTSLAFTAAINDPGRFRRSRDIGAYLGLVPRRYQSGEVDYTGSISKCGDRRVRTLLYEAANVILTRYKGPLKLKDWAFAIAKRSAMRKARIALARRLAIIMHAMLRNGTEFNPA
jgi:transposase